MEKLEHLALMLNRRTKGKKYENFVINSIYTKIANPDLIPITQQYVKNPNFSDTNKKKYYLLDLYFPQLKYGIEIDESHHLSSENIILDEIRAEDVLTAIQCEEGRIAIFNSDGTTKTYDEVNAQICEQVKYVQKLISLKEKNDGKKISWENNEERKKTVIEKGFFSTSDDVDYEGVTEIYNLLGHNVENLGRCFVRLNSSYKLWVPYLAIKLDDGTVKTKNGWENTLSEDKSTIYEVVGDMNKCDTRNLPDSDWHDTNRVIFMHIKDSFGMDRVKFLGIYEPSNLATTNGVQTRTYKRIATEVKIKDLFPES